MKPKQGENEHEAFSHALHLEKDVNQALLDLHNLATSHNDANFTDFLRCVGVHSPQRHFHHRRTVLLGDRVVLQGYPTCHQRRSVCIPCRFRRPDPCHETGGWFHEAGVGSVP
uniref:Ferritin n=1 Tax=Cacopsylla melanoneura TaxID=428564 RepID=A0A8D8S3D7_9HEMI